MIFSLLDDDLSKILLHFKMSDKQTEWIENCQRQFCKMMKAKPDTISGGGECIVLFFWGIFCMKIILIEALFSED